MLDPSIFKSMDSISLEEMGEVRLMNRVDTKYVAHISAIEKLLKLMARDYFIQEINGEFNMPYSTCYYDTPDTDMFYQHQRGKKTRQKIRTRIYEGSDSPPFLEIKLKSNTGRTRKKRVEMLENDLILNYEEFLSQHSKYETELLIPKIRNHFFRITLVNKDKTERITIDTCLEFHNFSTGKNLSLNDIAIIEWKRDGASPKSKLLSYLRDLRIQQSGFSKYCIGLALTDPDSRQNRLKPKLRYIEKLAKTPK